MSKAFVRQNADGSFSLGNAAFELVVGLTAGGFPALRLLRLSQSEVDWASPAAPLGPELTIQGVQYSLSRGNLLFSRFQADTELRLVYGLDQGLEVTQHFQPSPDKAVWRSWLSLHNLSAVPIEGITRFDAANLVFSAGESHRYRADFWSGLPERNYTGAELMEKGYTCTLENTRNADTMVLTKK